MTTHRIIQVVRYYTVDVTDEMLDEAYGKGRRTKANIDELARENAGLLTSHYMTTTEPFEEYTDPEPRPVRRGIGSR